MFRLRAPPEMPANKKNNHIFDTLTINKVFSTQSYNWGHLVGECCSLSRISIQASGRETSWPCRSIQNHQGTGKCPRDPITMPQGLCSAWLKLFTNPTSLQDCRISPDKMAGQNIFLPNLKNFCLFFRILVIINRCMLPRYSKICVPLYHTNVKILLSHICTYLYTQWWKPVFSDLPNAPWEGTWIYVNSWVHKHIPPSVICPSK